MSRSVSTPQAQSLLRVRDSVSGYAERVTTSFFKQGTTRKDRDVSTAASPSCAREPPDVVCAPTGNDTSTRSRTGSANAAPIDHRLPAHGIAEKDGPTFGERAIEGGGHLCVASMRADPLVPLLDLCQVYPRSLSWIDAV